jgi:hypothetical protein
MNRYWILTDENSNKVMISPLLDEQPLNSLIYSPNNFVKPIFDVYPNPTQVVEGASEQDILDFNKPLVPQELTLGKFMTYLALIGLEQTVLDKIEMIQDSQQKTMIKTYLKYGGFVERNSQAILFFQSILQKSDSEVDELFINANNILL